MTPAPAARLLVVDDNRTNRLILERGLTAQGFAVLEAESGSAALELLAATLGQAPRESPGPETIDLVLLDIMMPGLDGTDVRPIITKALSLLEAEFAAAGVEVSTDFAPSLPPALRFPSYLPLANAP